MEGGRVYSLYVERGDHYVTGGSKEWVNEAEDRQRERE